MVQRFLYIKNNKFFKLSEILNIIRSDYTKIGNRWIKKEI